MKTDAHQAFARELRRQGRAGTKRPKSAPSSCAVSEKAGKGDPEDKVDNLYRELLLTLFTDS